MRGVNEDANGAELDAQEILDVLGVFGEDGVWWYLIGVLEGTDDRREEEILQAGRIVAVEFKDGDETSDARPAIVTIRKRKYEIIEYEDPDDLYFPLQSGCSESERG